MEKHPVQEYIEKNNLTQEECAAQFEVTQPYISQLARGLLVCGPKVAKRILLKTGGEITLADLMFWEPPEPQDRTKGSRG